MNEGFFAGWRVVIVDDDPDSLMITKMLFERAGSQIFTATNGAECLALLRVQLPQLAICDLSMPVMSGWELIAAVKLDPLLQAIPMVAFSAHALREDQTRALAAGFRHYLTKPLNPRTFIEELARLLKEYD
jgi:CheY-like chemotaxis protein